MAFFSDEGDLHMDDDLFEFWGALCDPHEIDDAFAATTASAAFAASESKLTSSAKAGVTATSASTQCPQAGSVHVPTVAKSAGKVSLTSAPENSLENETPSTNSKSREFQSAESQIGTFSSSSSTAASNNTTFVAIAATSSENSSENSSGNSKLITGPRVYAMSHSYSSLYSDLPSSKNVLAAISDDESSSQDEKTKLVSCAIK